MESYWGVYGFYWDENTIGYIRVGECNRLDGKLDGSSSIDFHINYQGWLYDTGVYYMDYGIELILI